jgi:catechol 2,3-dioxygenase-like lactoylglutathione lyase family enzyme
MRAYARGMAPRFLLNIDVPDLEAGERFYTRAFGLVPGRRLGEGFLELRGWPVDVYLLAKPPGTRVSPVAPSLGRAYGRHWTPVHIDVVVEDIEAALSRALAAGATLEAPVSDEPYGRLALLADPFGHGVCLIQFNERGYDAIAT